MWLDSVFIFMWHSVDQQLNFQNVLLFSHPPKMIFLLSHRWDISIWNIPSSYCKTDESLNGLEDGLIIKSIIKTPHLPFISLLLGPWGPSGKRGDVRWQAVCQAGAMALPVTFPHRQGASGASPQRELARGAGAEDHSHRDHSDRGWVGGMELAISDLPGPLVFLQFLHPVPQQVHPVTAGGGTQHAR